MASTDPAELADAARAYRALADDTRLRILQLLAGTEICVCELAGQLDLPQPLLSFHLRTLREAGLVTAQRRGRWAFYSLDPKALAETGRLPRELVREHRKARALKTRCC